MIPTNTHFAIWRIFHVGLFWLLLAAVYAQPVVAEDAKPAGDVIVKRGLTSQLTFSSPSATLMAVPDQSMDSELLVRLERTKRSDQKSTYTLWFFGTVTGSYDLRDYVVESDGSPVPANQALPVMPVQIVSDLPPGRGTSLYEIDDPALRSLGGYRAILILFAVLWAAVPIVWGYIRWRNRRPVPVEVVVPEPTLADHLRPLVHRASQGDLSVAEQSRLELLIYTFWQQKLNLPPSLVDAVPVMRRDAKAGELLRSMEAWIHDHHAKQSTLDSATMEALLAPYRAAEAKQIDETVSAEPSVVGGTA